MAASIESELENLTVSVKYCDHCTLPTEYCEFTDCARRETEDGGEHKRQTRGGKAQGGVKVKKPADKKIQVFRSNRGKKKYVTVITGMGTFNVDLKDASKSFSKKFACSASVTGPDEIVIQGDVKYELIELIPEKYPEIDPDLIEDCGDQKR